MGGRWKWKVALQNGDRVLVADIYPTNTILRKHLAN